MKLLVTGGAGFIGSHFVRTVLANAMPGLEDARVTVLDKLTYAGNFANLGPVAENERLDFIPGDICDAALVDTAVRDIDAIVHAAAESHDDFATTNLVGTQVLLDAALRHGVERFLQVSTDEVYGSIDTGAWAERSPVAPISPFAATKAGADLLVLACHRTHGLPVVVTRCAENYGPYQHPEKLVPMLVTDLLRGRKPAVDGGQVRDWVHVDDHCRGLALALTEGRAGETYHIGGAGELSHRDIADRLAALCGGEVSQAAEAARTRRALDDDKIRRDLGYRPRIDLDEGLAATVSWYRDHEEWWRPLVAD
jgi:dTDP-glucose 4,6-dehydratase